MLGHDTRCSLLLHPEHDERQNRDSSVHINILTIQRWKVVSVGKRPVKLTGSIVKAFITCWWAVNALCTKQPPACDTSTHTRWLYNAFITAIRSSEEAERPLTCVKAAQHTSHIAADSQGWRLEAGGWRRLRCIDEKHSLKVFVTRAVTHRQAPRRPSVEFESRDRRGEGERGGRCSHEIKTVPRPAPAAVV